MQDLVTASEVAQKLKCSRESVVRLIQQGKAAGQLVAGRWVVPAAEVDRLVEQRRAASSSEPAA